MTSTSRVLTRASVLAATAVLGVAAAFLLFGVQRARTVTFDVPELVAVALGLLTSIAAFIGLKSVQGELRERERTERELRASERKFSGILAIAADAIISVSADQRIVHFNEGAEHIFGWTAAEAIGQPLSILLPDHLRTLHARHMEDFAHAEEVSRRMGSRQTIRGKRRSGEEFAAEASISRLDIDAGRLFTVVLRDVSERKREEDNDRFMTTAVSALGRSLDYEATLRSVVHLAIPYLADCCVLDVLQEDGSVRRIASVHDDPGLTKLLRQLERRSPAATNWPFPLADVISSVAPAIRRVDPGWEREGSPGGDAESVVAALGIHAFITTPMRAHGRVLGALTAISTDPRRQCSEQECRLAEELTAQVSFAVENAALYDSAQRAGRARDELLSVVSHDLRNPLSAVAMCARVLLDTPPDADASRRELAGAILQSTEIMNRMIQDLLDASIIESGHLRISCTPQRLEPLIARVLDMHRESAAPNDIALEVDVTPECPLIHADGTRVIQVLANLVGNAIKFTGRGGRVLLRARSDGHFMTIDVVDNGVGIPKSDQPHIFDRYWHARRTSRTPGTGLGLAIARGIVDAHGGQLSVTSVPGEGSTFSFTIPLAVPSAAERADPDDAVAIR